MHNNGLMIFLTSTVIPWPFQHMFLKQSINFEIFISTHGILKNIHYFFSRYFLIWNNLKISTFKKNMISVKLAKILGYSTINIVHEMNCTFLSHWNHCSWVAFYTYYNWIHYSLISFCIHHNLLKWMYNFFCMSHIYIWI